MKSWSSDVTSVSASAKSLYEGVSRITDTFENQMSTRKMDFSDQHVVPMARALQRQLHNTSDAFADCLNDLLSMSDGMVSLMEADESNASGVMLSLYTVFLKQLGTYLKDSSAAVEDGLQQLRQTKREMSSAGEGASRSNSVSTFNVGNSSQTTNAAMNAGQSTYGGDAPPISTPTRSDAAAALRAGDSTASTQFAAPPPPAEEHHKKKKKKKGAIAGNEMDSVQDDLYVSQAQPSGSAASDTAAAAAAAAAAAGESSHFDANAGMYGGGDDVSESESTSGAHKKKKRKKAVAAAVDDVAADSSANAAAGTSGGNAAATQGEYGMPSVHPLEPEYLIVNSTVNDGLGRLILSARPDSFSPIESLTRTAPRATYYVHLPQSGRLALLLATSYIAVEEELQADFMCDLLEVDAVEVEPFESVEGEVVLPETLDDLRSIPVCAWRLGASEDRSKMLYTMYVLTEDPTSHQRSILIHDSLGSSTSRRRDEVLHVVSLVDAAPQFAQVSVYDSVTAATSRNASAGEGNVQAIHRMTKSLFEQCGFLVAENNEVESALQKSTSSRASSTAAKSGMSMLRAQRITNQEQAPVFQPPVELASLNGPEHTGGVLSGVARGAVGVATGLVYAPLNMSKAVGNAVIDISGVGTAIKNSSEALFRRSFPNLAGEAIIDSFNCAWVAEDNVVKQGVLHVTQRWLCFTATVLNAVFSVEFEEIRSIDKARSMKVLDNAITITTHLDETYFLTSFLQRDKAHGALMRYWVQSSH